MTRMQLLGIAFFSGSLILGSPLGAQEWSPFALSGVTLETVAVHPFDPDILFAGGGPEFGAGMFRSLDGGVSWKPINVGLGTVHRVNTIGFDIVPINPPVPGPGAGPIAIFIGVLKIGGPNLFKSTDLGETWQPATTGLPNTTDEVTAFVFDAGAPGTGYAALNGTVGGVSKTTTSGDSWADASTGLADGFCTAGCVLDLAIDPMSPTTLYSAMPVLANVYKSTNGGGSWSTTTATLWPEELVLAPTQPAILYASGTVPGEGGVQKTINGGLSWTDLSSSPGLPQPASDSSHRAMALDPTNPDSVWLVVEDVFASPGPPLEAVYHSTDGGLQWALTDAGLEGVRVQGLTYWKSWVLAATDDGVFRTFDGLFADGFESGNLAAWSGP